MEGVLLTNPDSIDGIAIDFLKKHFGDNGLNIEGFFAEDMKKEHEWECPTIIDRRTVDDKKVHAYHACGFKCIQLHSDDELFGNVLGFSFAKVNGRNGNPHFFLNNMYWLEKGDNKMNLWWGIREERTPVPITLSITDFIDLPGQSVLREKGFRSMHFNLSYVFRQNERLGIVAMLLPDSPKGEPCLRFIYTKHQLGTYFTQFDPPHQEDAIGFDYFFNQSECRLVQKYSTPEDGREFKGYLSEHVKLPEEGRKPKTRRSRLETELGIHVPIRVKKENGEYLFKIKNIYQLPGDLRAGYKDMLVAAVADPKKIMNLVLNRYQQQKAD